MCILTHCSVLYTTLQGSQTWQCVLVHFDTLLGPCWHAAGLTNLVNVHQSILTHCPVIMTHCRAHKTDNGIGPLWHTAELTKLTICILQLWYTAGLRELTLCISPLWHTAGLTKLTMCISPLWHTAGLTKLTMGYSISSLWHTAGLTKLTMCISPLLQTAGLTNNDNMYWSIMTFCRAHKIDNVYWSIKTHCRTHKTDKVYQSIITHCRAHKTYKSISLLWHTAGLGSGRVCGLWLWHSLDFSLTFFTKTCECVWGLGLHICQKRKHALKKVFFLFVFFKFILFAFCLLL